MSIAHKGKVSGYAHNNNVSLVFGGRPYFELLLQLIGEAKESVHLQAYIFDEDETGQMVADALVMAAKRNVQVHLLVDGYASQGISNSFVESLKKGGVNFRFFDPLFKSKYYYFGRRLHHKLAVFDSSRAIVGGINISNNYNDLPGKPAWFDFALHLEGETARELCILCWKTWFGYPKQMDLTPCEEKLIQFDINPSQSSQVRMRRNDWVRRKNEVSGSYLEIFRQASDQVIVISSYFLPGKRFKKNMAAAVRRGARVKLILASRSDVWIAKQAERHIYRWLLKNRIEIYEYQSAILHGKMAICDSKWMTLGSYNLNNISAFASIELNLDVKDEKFVHSVRNMVESIIDQDCIQVSEENFRARSHFLQRLWQDICYETIRLLFYLFTFYFKQKE
ncbi:MAG: phosphatidylserine/phosphatidylglycerophosphate/cardiolipin synthase family protein [Chitinophagales bacterium]